MSWERQQSVVQWLGNLETYFPLDILAINELISLFVEHLLTIHYVTEVNIKTVNKTDTFPALLGLKFSSLDVFLWDINGFHYWNKIILLVYFRSS